MGIAARIKQWLRSRRVEGDPGSVAALRAQWRAIAAEHGLGYEPGPHAGYFQDDRMHGELGGRRVSVAVGAAYDVQNLVVEVRVRCDVVTSIDRPARDALVAWYEERREAAGLPALDPELAPWLLGRRLGVGAFLEPERELVYLQMYGIEPETLRMMLAKLPVWAQQLELAARA